MTGAWVATGFCVAALVALVAAEFTGSRRGRYVSKPTASVAFIVVACLLAPGFHGYAGWVVAGLVLGALGDVALMFEGERAFLGGLGAFLLGHLAYVIAFVLVQPLAHWNGWVVPAPVVVAALVYAWLWPHLGSMRVPVLGYTTVITAMALSGLSLSIYVQPSELPHPPAMLATAGACLFFISDLAVARDKFVSEGPLNRLWGLPAYYFGQLLLAWSVAGG